MNISPLDRERVYLSLPGDLVDPSGQSSPFIIRASKMSWIWMKAVSFHLKSVQSAVSVGPFLLFSNASRVRRASSDITVSSRPRITIKASGCFNVARSEATLKLVLNTFGSVDFAMSSVKKVVSIFQRALL